MVYSRKATSLVLNVNEKNEIALSFFNKSLNIKKNLNNLLHAGKYGKNLLVGFCFPIVKKLNLFVHIKIMMKNLF